MYFYSLFWLIIFLNHWIRSEDSACEREKVFKSEDDIVVSEDQRVFFGGFLIHFVYVIEIHEFKPVWVREVIDEHDNWRWNECTCVGMLEELEEIL